MVSILRLKYMLLYLNENNLQLITRNLIFASRQNQTLQINLFSLPVGWKNKEKNFKGNIC